jgi:hypothetical protein
MHVRGRCIRSLAAFSGLAFLVANAGATSAASGDAGKSENARQPPPREAKKISVEGAFVHSITRLALPEVVGPFSRRAVHQYDPEGFDVSGLYYLGDPTKVLATVYHYPVNLDLADDQAAEALAKHFRVVRHDITHAHPEFAFVEETTFRIPINGYVYRGLKALYEAPRFQRFDEPVRSTAYLFSIGKWYLKFRFTYPRRFASELDALQGQFISAFLPVPPVTGPGPICESLADSYALYAKVRDAGVSRERTLAISSEEKAGPADAEARRVILHAIDFAYANPDKNPSEVRAAVLGDCELDREGRPALRTLWPWRN